MCKIEATISIFILCFLPLHLNLLVFEINLMAFLMFTTSIWCRVEGLVTNLDDDYKKDDELPPLKSHRF